MRIVRLGSLALLTNYDITLELNMYTYICRFAKNTHVHLYMYNLGCSADFELEILDVCVRGVQGSADRQPPSHAPYEHQMALEALYLQPLPPVSMSE